MIDYLLSMTVAFSSIGTMIIIIALCYWLLIAKLPHFNINKDNKIVNFLSISATITLFFILVTFILMIIKIL
jgi:hypothetical protein